jgi:predicted esterase
VTALAPRQFLLTAGETDPLFPFDGVRSIVEKAQHRYAQEGAPEHFQAILFPAGHQFPEEVKEAAYGFLDHWLK